MILTSEEKSKEKNRKEKDHFLKHILSSKMRVMTKKMTRTIAKLAFHDEPGLPK